MSAPLKDGSQTWISYDSVAATYQRVAAPRFAPLAADLVSVLNPRPGEWFFDLGTGTGLVATTASRAVMPHGLVIGIDPSIGMLSWVPRQEVQRIVAKAPALPFVDSSFDVGAANLVLSHTPDIVESLTAVARVLTVGGRFGATAWAPEPPVGRANDAPEANELVALLKSECQIPAGPPVNDAVPFEEWLRDEQNLRSSFMKAGFEDVAVECRRYEHRTPVADFLSGWGSNGRYARQRVGAKRWEEFTQRASGVLFRRFGESIGVVEDVWLIIGRRS